MKHYQYRVQEIAEIAEAILANHGPNRTYALIGELGAGKTTLVAEMCRQLGVTEPTSSPTFSILNEYTGSAGPIFHLDCYRLDSIEEALDAGLEELFDREESPIFVEWPGIIEPLLPADVVYLRLTYALDGQARELTISTGHPPSNER